MQSSSRLGVHVNQSYVHTTTTRSIPQPHHYHYHYHDHYHDHYQATESPSHQATKLGLWGLGSTPTPQHPTGLEHNSTLIGPTLSTGMRIGLEETPSSAMHLT